MPKEYERKSNRAKNYTKENLKTAVEKVRRKELTNYAAAKLYGIPTSTLNDRVRQKTGVLSQTLGRPPAIPFELETKLAHALRILEKWGWGLSRNEVLEIVAEFVRKNNLHTQFKDGKPGNEWFISFRQRHNLSIKKPQPVEYLRKRMTDPFVINEYFTILEETLTKLELNDPNRIWNLDETSVSLDPTKTKVVGAVGMPCTRTTAGTGKENTTVLTTVNALGVKLTPLIVYKGQNVYEEWMAESKDEYDFEIAYAASKRGWMETEIFYNYMEKIVIPSFGTQRPVLMIYDGHSTHVDEKVVSLAAANDVTILKLPPHTSHLLQPLDLAVFKSLKSKWDQKLVLWQRQNVGSKIRRKEFAEMFAETWHQTTSSVIQNGFKKGGIYPYNRNVIPKEKYDPNALKRWRQHQVQTGEQTPKTLKQLCTAAINNAMCNKASDSTIQTVASTSSTSNENASTSTSISVQFEELLLKKITQQNSCTNTLTKRTRVSKGAEVITQSYLKKQKEIQLSEKKEKETHTKSNVKNLKKTDSSATDNQIPGPSTQNTGKSRNSKCTTAKGKGVGKKSRIIVESFNSGENKNKKDLKSTGCKTHNSDGNKVLDKSILKTGKKRTKSYEKKPVKRSKRSDSIDTTPESTQISIYSDSDVFDSLSDLYQDFPYPINAYSEEEIEKVATELNEVDEHVKEEELGYEEVTSFLVEQKNEEMERQTSHMKNQTEPNLIIQADNLRKNKATVISATEEIHPCEQSRKQKSKTDFLKIDQNEKSMSLQAVEKHNNSKKQTSDNNKENNGKAIATKQTENIKKEKVTILSSIRMTPENQKFYNTVPLSLKPIDITYQLRKCSRDDSTITSTSIMPANIIKKDQCENSDKIVESDNDMTRKQKIVETYNIGQTVLTRYYSAKNWKYYVGKVEAFNQNTETYTICFYKTIGKKTNVKFIVPKRKDKDSYVPDVNIVKEFELLQISDNPEEYTLMNDEDGTYF